MAESPAATTAPRATRPIFILGILPRCGTNFLHDLLCAHPDCGAPDPIHEDFLTCHVDQLETYVETVKGRWTPGWGVNEETTNQLRRNLGDGLCAFLAEHASGRRVVTKTPRVDGLDSFFRFFPNAHLLILIRDGRAVLESGVKTFGWNRESAMHRWAIAAQTIREFQSSHQSTEHRFRVVRYEDLWSDLDGELRRLFDFLNLDAARYDFDAAAKLPVRGSSTVRDQSGEAMHWKPVEKTIDFDPTKRWSHWSRAQHERFRWVAGKWLAMLGYENETYTHSSLGWGLWSRLLDVKWCVIRTLGPLWLRFRRGHRSRKGRMSRQNTPEAERPT